MSGHILSEDESAEWCFCWQVIIQVNLHLIRDSAGKIYALITSLSQAAHTSHR